MKAVDKPHTIFKNHSEALLIQSESLSITMFIHAIGLSVENGLEVSLKM